ncbi:molecular chaperone [Mariprofundus ferrooxydans]|nr:molecular chaperone [Mariprofundus ferrooxydans]
MNLKHILTAMLCCMAMNNIASAGSFNVYPTRLAFEEGAKIGSVTVVNESDEVANMQVRAMLWKQGENGKDAMQATQRLTFFPKIFRLLPHQKKVIRVGYQEKALAKELAFRLFIRELPVDEPGKMGMKMAVQISMPVFIRPIGTSREPLPTVKAISVVDGKLVGWVENTGRRYLMAKKLELSGSKNGKETYSGTAQGWYVLAGINKAFPLELSSSDCRGMDRLSIKVVTEAGKKEKSFTLNDGICDEITDQAKSVAVSGKDG